jgi:CheY-like chemotaxis protein
MNRWKSQRASKLPLYSWGIYVINAHHEGDVKFKIPFFTRKAKKSPASSQSVPLPIRKIHSPSASAKKILVVDDNEVILKTISLKLKGVGYQAVTAQDGAEAMSVVRMEKPDLILLDIVFPPDVAGVPWDGFRIMEWLHRVDESRKIPIIIITGGEEVKNKERAIASGAVAFFHKPINHDDLIKVIHATLADH